MQVERDAITPDLISGEDDVYTKLKLEYRLDRLRKVLITGLFPSRSLVELTIHILESAASLERMMLDRFCPGAPPWAEREGEKHKDG